MLSLRNFWKRNKKKIFVTVGVSGGGYVLYKLYATHTQRLLDLGEQLDLARQADELIKAQLQLHFESIQRIVDTTTLPYAMSYLRNRLSEELDISDLTNRLNQTRGQPKSLERLELWEKLKIISFTRMVLSLWGMTILNLYVRIQVNILGRHLYIDAARDMEKVSQFDRHGQQEFLATADYLSIDGMVRLIPNMQKAATEVLKEKKLTDIFDNSLLRETIMQILNMFMSTGNLHDWVTYLIPESAVAYEQSVVAHSKDSDDIQRLPDDNILNQLIGEARGVLMSTEFRNVLEISVKSVVNALMEEVGSQSGGIPLARLFARVSQMGPLLMEEPKKNRFIQIIQSLPEVELFYTLLYTNTGLQGSEST